MYDYLFFLSPISASINKSFGASFLFTELELNSTSLCCYGSSIALLVMAKEMHAPCQKEMNNGPGQQSDNAIITSAAGVKVMVVDDDVVCLSIVSGILRTWKYQGTMSRF